MTQPCENGDVYRVAAEIASAERLPADAVARIAAVPHTSRAIPGDYLTTDEAAAVLKCGRDVVVELCRSGRLPALQIGTGIHLSFRVRHADLAVLAYRSEQ